MRKVSGEKYISSSFPSQSQFRGHVSLQLKLGQLSSRETDLAVVYESDSSYLVEPSPAKETISLEEFSSFALPEEFRRRATALVASAVRPLETKLLDQVSSMAQDSQRAITAKYQQLRSTSFQDYNMVQGLTIPSSPLQSGFGDLFSTMPALQTTTESGINNLVDCGMEQSDQVDFDSFLDLWGAPNAIHQLASGPCPSDSGFASNLSCSCIGTCTCHTVMDRQSSTPSQSGQIAEASSLTKDSKIISLLQSMTRSILALEKRLQVAETPT